MTALHACFIAFAITETLNLLELYFMQDNCIFNGACIYTAWEKSKQIPEVNELMRYLINWIAGIKLIVVGLVLVLVFTAPEQTLIWSAVVMILTIGSFFWRMYPMMRKADDAGQILAKGRSRLLAYMVAGLQLSFLITMVITLVTR
ncbi:MAG: hypothetical protein JEZ06_05975 [Anaerolineaceae bacterium]|nr:hypothetical protein [Anaerolineaceae bacterium]